MTPRRCVKSKIKQLCCEDEFSGYGKIEIPKPLAPTQVLAVKQMKRDIGN
jgi:hypothetical protein